MINVTSSQSKLHSVKFEEILYLTDPYLYKILFYLLRGM